MLGLGGAILVLCAFFFVQLVARPQRSAHDQRAVIAAALGAMALLGAFILERAQYAVELTDEWFSIRFFGRREYSCARFVVFRRKTTLGKGGRFYSYHLVGGPGQQDVAIRIDSNFFSSEDKQRVERWIARFPDLESADLDREASERRERGLHPGSGRAPIGRKRARRIARAFGWTGILAIVLTFVIGRTPTYSVARLAMAIPICLVLPATVALKVWQPDAFQLGSAVGSRLPASLNTAFSMGCLAPIFPAAFGYRPMRWESAIPAALVVAALVGYPLFRWGLRRLDRNPRGLAFTAALLLVYAYSASLTLNGALDHSRPALRSGIVRDRWETGGRGHSYMLLIEWKDVSGEERKLAVSPTVFGRSPVGSEIRVAIGLGAFRIPWIAGVFPPE